MTMETMSRHILVSRGRGTSASPAAWLFPVLILLSVLLPVPLFVLTWLLCVSLVVRPRASPEDRSNLYAPFLCPLNPRGPPF